MCFAKTLPGGFICAKIMIRYLRYRWHCEQKFYAGKLAAWRFWCPLL